VASASKCAIDGGGKLSMPVLAPAHGVVEVPAAEVEYDGRPLSGFEKGG